jgi:hypothetical protein
MEPLTVNVFDHSLWLHILLLLRTPLVVLQGTGVLAVGRGFLAGQPGSGYNLAVAQVFDRLDGTTGRP